MRAAATTLDPPVEWRRGRLDQFAEVQLGRQRSPKNHSGPNMRPYLRAANVTWHGFKLDDVKHMNFDPDEAARFRLRDGDLLLSEGSGSPDEVGKPALWHDEIHDCCFQNTLLRVRPGPHVLPKYLLHLFGYEAKRGHFGSASRGVNIHHLGSQTLAAWPVAIPPLEEQKLIIEAIEEQFSRLDAGVESLQRAKRNLDGLRASILEAAFEGLPTAPLSTRLREPLRNGKSAKKAVNGAVRVFTLTAVTESDFSERNTKIVDLEPADLDDLWAAPGDLFVERSNTPDLVGTTALFSGPSSWAIFPDLLIRVRLDETTEPRFAELAIGAPRLRRYFRSRAKGIAGSMPKIDQETVASAPLPAIPLDRQLHIVSEVDRQLSILDATARALDGGLRRASGLRQSILHDAFAGRLIDRVGGRARTTMEGGNAGG